MIPLYSQDTVGRGPYGNHPKNPIYFIRKSISTLPASSYDIAVLNTDSSMSDIFPPVSILHDQPGDNAYDVESVDVQFITTEYVEPKALGDGSSATEPLHHHAIITLSGFVRGESMTDLQQKISFLNYSFDPVINYLEGASTWDNTIEPGWQPFENSGFSVLAWFDHAARAGSPGGSEDGVWEGEAINPFTVEPYGRLNRFFFARSIAKPVPQDYKFTDFSAPFNIKLLVVDPRIYEFIPPEEWFGSYEFGDLSSKVFIDQGHSGVLIESENGTVEQYTNEDFVIPEYLWRIGPGYREVSTDVEGPVVESLFVQSVNPVSSISQTFGNTVPGGSDEVLIVVVTHDTTEGGGGSNPVSTPIWQPNGDATNSQTMLTERSYVHADGGFQIFYLNNPNPSSSASARIFISTDGLTRAVMFAHISSAHTSDPIRATYIAAGTGATPSLVTPAGGRGDLILNIGAQFENNVGTIAAPAAGGGLTQHATSTVDSAFGQRDSMSGVGYLYALTDSYTPSWTFNASRVYRIASVVVR